MNTDFYIFGTPNNNIDHFFSYNKKDLLEEFAKNRQSNVQLVVYHKNQLIYYTYLHYGLLSKQNKEGAYLGISIVLNSVEFQDEKAILKLFDDLFNSMVRDGKIVSLDDAGKTTFTIERFYKEQAIFKEYEYILRRKIDEQFDQLHRDYRIISNPVDNYDQRIKILSINGEIWHTQLKQDNTLYRNSFFKDFFAQGRERLLLKKKIVMPLLIVLVLLISTISIIKSQDKSVSRDEKVNIENQCQIEGRYVCSIKSPQKMKLKVEITRNPSSQKYLAQFINYNHSDTLFASDLFVSSDLKEISNETLGQGSIMKNSMGEIEIISKPENEKKWNMRKIQ